MSSPTESESGIVEMFALNSKWKISTYRPFRIIARDPDESTYEVGDDKFPTLIDVCGPFEKQKMLATRIVSDHNSHAALLAERDALRDACKKALTCASLNSDVRQLIVAALNPTGKGE